MNKQGPIIIIEDVMDDQEILMAIYKELNYDNELIFFGDSEEALKYLTSTDMEDPPLKNLDWDKSNTQHAPNVHQMSINRTVSIHRN